MRRFILSLSALSMALPAFVVPTVADARHVRHYRGHSDRYARRYRGESRRYVQCRHSDGTTGLIAGGVGGAVVGSSVIGHGVLGPILGGVGGALGGRAIDRTLTAKKRCN